MKEQKEQIDKCYSICPGKDIECALYNQAEPFLKGKDCLHYVMIENDIEKIHRGNTKNITYGDIVDKMNNTFEDIQFHVDKQGIKFNIELMGRAFGEQYNNKHKGNIIHKDKQQYISDNIYDCIDAKIKVDHVHKLLHRGKW